MKLVANSSLTSHMDVSPVGVGHRIYEVRSALGPNDRHEMPQRAFAELLNAAAEELIADEEERPTYDSSVIARLEAGKRRASVYDITVVAAVDPLRRGVVWLAWDDLADDLTPALPSVEERAETEAGTPTVAEREAALAAEIGGVLKPKGKPTAAFLAERETKEKAARKKAANGGNGGGNAS